MTRKPEAMDADEMAQAVEATAFSLAKRWCKVEPDGTLLCCRCDTLPALIPSLHCGKCLGAHYIKHHIVLPHCMNRAQTDEDRAAPGR